MPTQHIRAWRNRRRSRITITYDHGTRLDLETLAPLHYRAGPPATIDRILCATDTEHGVLAGVLVTSRPTLNGAWRKIAWGSTFASGDLSADARRINAELRTISRVIVDPRFRGLGVGSGLVRRYLAEPVTRCTEAVTAIGTVSPFFERAGMHPILMPPQARHARLMRAINTNDTQIAAVQLMQPSSVSQYERPLRTWARTSASTRRLAAGDLAAIAGAAAGALLAPPMAYAHG